MKVAIGIRKLSDDGKNEKGRIPTGFKVSHLKLVSLSPQSNPV